MLQSPSPGRRRRSRRRRPPALCPPTKRKSRHRYRTQTVYWRRSADRAAARWAGGSPCRIRRESPNSGRTRCRRGHCLSAETNWGAMARRRRWERRSPSRSDHPRSGRPRWRSLFQTDPSTSRREARSLASHRHRSRTGDSPSSRPAGNSPRGRRRCKSRQRTCRWCPLEARRSRSPECCRH